MKATAADVPPAGDGWVHEVKWDGMRVLVAHDASGTSLTSANGLDATTRFPEVVRIGGALGAPAVLDGEVIAQGPDSLPDFGRLQRRMHLSTPRAVQEAAVEVPVSLVCFDLLWFDGHDLCGLPWLDRRAVLDQVLEPAASWRLSPVHDDGDVLLDAVRAQGLEGLVSKRVDSTYVPGKRTTSWRKVKVRLHQEVVVGGWWPGTGNRDGGLGSLLVGVHDPAAPGSPLRFAGRVGSGLSAADLRTYEALLAPLATDTCPFDPPPPSLVRRQARWVRPEVVVEVAFGEWTAEGVLRHPSLLGRRLDKSPADVVRE
jgi:bifunctional non-homologous end joining protein LigD